MASLRVLAQAITLAAVTLCAATAPASSKHQTLTTLSPDQIAAFKPYTLFASAAYCAPATTLTWTCGANCAANPAFEPLASGGNDGTVQYWYVGFDPTQSTIVVAHQGTDSKNFRADLTDLKFPLAPLDADFFPGVGDAIKVHGGFAAAHARTAPAILAALQAALAAHPGGQVVLTGHSLGAALALLDAVYLPLHLPPGVAIRAIGYGLPRVGNAAFADYVDAHVQLAHVTNRKDPFPGLPFEDLGFRQPAGEVHIDGKGAWVACPGQENGARECTDGTVRHFWDGRMEDHEGPYDGVVMGLGEC